MSVLALAKEGWEKFSQSSFDLDLNLVSPDGLQTAVIKGIGTDNERTLDTDGQEMIGRIVHIGFSENALLTAFPNYPTRNDKDEVSLQSHLVSFLDSRGVLKDYKVKQTYPDSTIGMIMCDCSDYKTHPLSPSSLVLSNETTTGFQVDFTTNSGNVEAGFEIEIDTVDDFANPITISTEKGIVSDIFSTGISATQYYVRVRAVGGISSKYTATVMTLTL